LPIDDGYGYGSLVCGRGMSAFEYLSGDFLGGAIDYYCLKSLAVSTRRSTRTTLSSEHNSSACNPGCAKEDTNRLESL